MKILYMGTAAYDGIPSPFCTCELCKKAYEKGGKNFRTRTQSLINDDLLIDFNGDSISHFLKYKVDTKKIKTCLITHSHSDHLYPEDIVIPQYSSSAVIVDFYAGKDGCDKIIKATDESDNPELVRKYIKVHEVKEGQEFYSAGYRILTLPADHDRNSSPVIYALEKDGKRMLYALDTGIFTDRVFDLLKGFGKLDLITFDCTGALSERRWERGHMCFTTDVEMFEKLKELGIADDNTKVVVNHFSHNGCSLHEDLEKEASKYGITVAYDGLEIEF